MHVGNVEVRENRLVWTLADPETCDVSRQHVALKTRCDWWLTTVPSCNINQIFLLICWS